VLAARPIQLVLGMADELVQVFAIDLTEHANRAARDRLEGLGRLAGGIAHDFNNLLVGVLAESSALREEATLAPGARESVQRIEIAARRMAQLTRQLMAYSGRGRIATTPVIADEVLSELAPHLPPVAVDGVTIGAGRVAVAADPVLLRQVVVNLANNAAEAGSSQIEVTSRCITRDDQPWWELEVSDDGCGIDDAARGHVFEPFFSTKSGHHGLGLSAVHGIVERFGGALELETRPTRGTRVRVQLPVVAPPPAPAVVLKTRLAGLRILVVDDDPLVRNTVRRLLERRGATVVVAIDGSDATARLEAEPFQLVVSDVSMPGMTGYQLVAIVRASWPDTKVVLMSGYTEPTVGDSEAPDGFLEKPFTAPVLDATLDEVLGRR